MPELDTAAQIKLAAWTKLADYSDRVWNPCDPV